MGNVKSEPVARLNTTIPLLSVIMNLQKVREIAFEDKLKQRGPQISIRSIVMISLWVYICLREALLQQLCDVLCDNHFPKNVSGTKAFNSNDYIFCKR